MKKAAALRLSLLLCSASLFSGCAVGPSYIAPDLSLPAAWRLEVPVGEAQALARPWEALGCSTLESLVQEALQHNLTLQQLTAAVEASASRYGIQRAALLPQIGAEASYRRQRYSSLSGQFPGGAGVGVTEQWSPAITAVWELDLWGKLRRGTEAAYADLENSEEQRRGAVLTVASEVALQYLTLREYDEKLAILQKTIATRVESHRLAKVRFDAGAISELELKQAEGEMAAAKAEVPVVQIAIMQSENALAVLLGGVPRSIPRGLPLSELSRARPFEAAVPTQVVAARPDVRAAEARLRVATAAVGVAIAEYFPSFSISGAFGRTSPTWSDLSSSAARTWQVVPGLQLPLLTFGRARNEVRARYAEARGAEAAYREVVLEALAQVTDALYSYERTIALLQERDAQVEILTRSRALAEVSYQAGQSSYLDVLDAERALLAAELQRASAQGSLARSYVTLYRVFGGGWIDAVDPSKASADDRMSAPLVP